MGCYDSVRFRCPSCGQRFLEQSKAGARDLVDYDSQAVPLKIAAALNGETVYCPHCQTEHTMRAQSADTVPVFLEPVGA